MRSVFEDVRQGLRLVAGHPAFTAVAVLSLAIGIGANTAIFSLVDALLLRPLPVERPAELAAVYTSDFSGPAYGASSFLDYLEFRERTDIFRGLAAFGPLLANIVAGQNSERASGSFTTGNFWEVLGVGPLRGRVYGPPEDTIGANPVAVLSDRFWRRLGEPAVELNGRISINGHAFTVIGIAPGEFSGLLPFGAVDFWVPAATLHQLRPDPNPLVSRGSRGSLVVGRLAPGVSRDQAQAAFTVLAGQLAAAYPDAWLDVRRQPRRLTLAPATRVTPMIRGSVAGFLALLMAIVGLVLLIACANVANLLLARAGARRREIAVRISLGASRGRLVRQLITESLVLSVLAGASGIILASWIVNAVSAFRPPIALPVPLDPSLDSGVLLFALALSLATGLLFGLAPALVSTRSDVVTSLKSDAAGAGRRRRMPLGHGLVMLQVAFSLLVLVAAGLLIRTLQQSQAVRLGFDPENVATARIDLTGSGSLTPERIIQTLQAIVDRLSALPNVSRASLATIVPLGLGASRRSVTVEGYQPQPGEDIERHFNVVSPGYFETMAIRIVRGRAFSDDDRVGSPPVAIVNETFARRFWNGDDPIGKRISMRGARGPWMEIVGITEDGRYVSVLDETLPYVFVPIWQNPSPAAVVHVRTATGHPAGIIPLIRDSIHDLQPSLPVFEAGPLADLTGIGLLPHRLAASWLGLFGGVALLLSAIGLYGVLGHAVSLRRREIGVRLAIGATPRAILALVLSQGMRVVLAGLAVGLGSALIAMRLLASMLYEVSPSDPLTFGLTTALLLLVALAASYLPARRAARLDPIRILRQE
jgi:predicted permease